MTDRNRKILVYSLCSVALIWSAFNWKTEPNAQVPSGLETITPIEQASLVAKSQTPLDTGYYDELPWGQDPFHAPKRSENNVRNKRTIALIVSGILYHPTDPTAFVNGKTVKVGDNISGATIIAIDKHSVTVQQDGELRKLSVNKG